MIEIQKIIYLNIRPMLLKISSAFNISSLQLTLTNHLITILGSFFFTTGRYEDGLIGLGILFANVIIDFWDGDIARETNTCNPMAAWWDAGFDVIIQNIVLGAIAIGCYKGGLSVWWIVIFFVGNSANNFVSVFYNNRFGFDSDKGNETFRKLMDRKCRLVNQFLKNLIDPTENPLFLALYTYRYWIIFGILFNKMVLIFKIITIVNNLKWLIMFNIYALYLGGYDKLFILKALSALDDEKEDFYNLR